MNVDLACDLVPVRRVRRVRRRVRPRRWFIRCFSRTSLAEQAFRAGHAVYGKCLRRFLRRTEAGARRMCRSPSAFDLFAEVEPIHFGVRLVSYRILRLCDEAPTDS